MDEIYNKITNPDECGIENNEISEIQKFYKNQSIFLTGCTGFVGKSIVEKLLRSCPDLKKLYLLVRPKKILVKDRIEKYFNDSLFNELRKLQSNFLSKIVIIEGNLESHNLGLSDNDKNIIINDATIFIHNASNVKFDIRVSESLNCNVFGTKNMLDLAIQCKYIKVFTYVSTAYSNCYENNILEKCYPPPGDLKLIQDLIDNDLSTPNGMSSSAIKEFISPWQNIYLFGKATAESLIEQYANNVSFCCTIFRPSIILPSYQEPTPGWTDGNFNGPTALYVAYGLGLGHVTLHITKPIDYIPVDMCTNALLTTIWDAVINRKEKGKVFVYNYGSSVVNPITINQLGLLAQNRGTEFPSTKMIAPYFVYFSKSIISFVLLNIIFHLIPAIFADIALIATLRKPVALKIVYKVIQWSPALYYFILKNNFRIHVNETTKAWDKMNKRDNELFYNDLRTFDWSIFCWYYWPSLRKYALKDPMSTVGQAQKRYNLMCNIFNIFCIAIILLFLYIFRNFIIFLMIPFFNLIKLINTLL